MALANSTYFCLAGEEESTVMSTRNVDLLWPLMDFFKIFDQKLWNTNDVQVPVLLLLLFQWKP